eukprot:Selendium_serpulae@DN3849_c0_g1_i2.p2
MEEMTTPAEKLECLLSVTQSLQQVIEKRTRRQAEARRAAAAGGSVEAHQDAELVVTGGDELLLFCIAAVVHSGLTDPAAHASHMEMYRDSQSAAVEGRVEDDRGMLSASSFRFGGVAYALSTFIASLQYLLGATRTSQ